MAMRLTLLALFISFATFPALATNTAALSFYRNQQSSLPSGQATRADLEKRILSRELEPWFRVRWNKKEFEVPGDIVIKDLQSSQTLVAKEKLDVLKSPQTGSLRAFVLPAKSTVVVLKTTSYWAEVVDLKSKQRGWAPLQFFTAPAEDRGVYITLIDSFLQKSAVGSADVITTIPRNVRLMPIDIEKNFLKVQYKGFKGYVELSNLAGRGDFAMWAYHKNQGWLGISHRENGFLITTKKQKIPLRDFVAFAPYQDRGVISQKLTEGGPSIRSRVEIVSHKAHRWTLSALEGHGEVWWRSEELSTAANEAGGQQITSDQLMKREIHSVAFASSKSLKGLASAGGVFRTDDGKTWTEIPQFAGQNFPVTILPDGAWYVGSYRSYDEGKTFESFIRWDKLAEQIQDSIHKMPRHLRITQIEPAANSRIRILVDTGVQKIKMQAHVLSQEWTLVK
jgi:hypothetical protein